MIDDDLPSSLSILDAAPTIGGDGARAASAPPDDGPPVAPLPDDEPGFDEGEGDPPPSDTDWEAVRLCAAEPQNDIGNSRRLRTRHGADMIHVQNIAWHVFDEQRWKEDVDGAGTRPRAHDTVEKINLEAHVIEPGEREQADLDAATVALTAKLDLEVEIRGLDDLDIKPDERKKRAAPLRERIKALAPEIERGAAVVKALQARKAQRRRFANTSGNKGKIDGMLAEAIPYLTKSIEDLDQEELALNVENGTLRFEQVEEPDPECPDPAARRLVKVWRARLYPHRREDLITKLCECTYDPKAEARLFVAFIERILPDESVRAFVQRWLGYSITAMTAEQGFCLFHGEGANGKSTLVDIVARLLNDYSTSVPIDTLVATGGPKKGSEATPDLARLPGARLVRTAEPKEGVAFDESLIKGLTSSEPIPVRRLNAEFVDVYPTFKITVSANRKPPIKGDDDGIWRRVHLVPFEVQIPKDERDKRLPEKLWEERSAVLNWLIEGCLDYLTRGKLDPPEAVTAATQEYREESDILAPFLAGALIITKSPDDVVEGGRLYESYKLYCFKSGTSPVQQTTFNRRMPKAAEKHGLTKGKSSVTVYGGVQIKAAFVPSEFPGRPSGGPAQGA